MEIKKYIDILLKRLWFIIVLPVVVGLISIYVNVFVLVPTYEAVTTLLITGLSTSTADTETTTATNMRFEDIIAGQSLISEYSAIINSKRVTGAVVQELNDANITEKDISSMISINSVDDTRIIAISIVHLDPSEAARIADIVAKVFSDEIVELYKIENVDIIDKAEVPEFPVAPEKTKNVALSVFAGFVFAVGIILLIEFLNTRIKTSEDVEMRLGLNVIGSIPVNSLNKGRSK